MTDLVNPYKNTIFYTRIKLLPYQMNNELYINLKNNLKKKVENKCNKYGYINNIHKILSYSDGTINAEDFTASAVFDIKYSANVVIPVENTKIIVKILKMNNMAILAENGPIKVPLKYDKISNKFKAVQGTILYNNKQIKVGEYLIISILAKRFYNKDKYISVYGYIEDVPTEEQIKEFFEINQEDKESIENESTLTEYVTFNEDEGVEENKSSMIIKENDYVKQSRVINL